MGILKGVASNGVLIATLAHALVGISLVGDKVLLNRRLTQNLAAYVFWLGAISVFGLALIPFGFQKPELRWAALGFAAGLLDLIASYFYYWALKAGEASDELAAMGGFAPVATALIAIPLLNQPIGGQLLGFALMTAGGFIMFFAEKRPLKTMLPKINHTNFVTGYVFVTLGTTVGSLCMLIPPGWRRQIFEHSEEAPAKSKAWYMLNRFTAGVGSFLGVYAVSLANPALVEAISGVRYVVVFLGAFAITRLKPAWFREDFRLPVLIAKVSATAFVVAGLVITGLRNQTAIK
jgi:uncharacterized membrane protein